MCSAVIFNKQREFFTFKFLNYSPFSNLLCHSSFAQGELIKNLIPPGLPRSSSISFNFPS